MSNPIKHGQDCCCTGCVQDRTPIEFSTWGPTPDGTPQQFHRCANLILDSVETAFNLPRISDRTRSYSALVEILNHYCLPNPDAWVPPGEGERP